MYKSEQGQQGDKEDGEGREEAEPNEEVDVDLEFGLDDFDYAISDEDDDLFAANVDDDGDKAKKMK
jgi:hypothetical protein